jgi:hypothetical protein
MTTTQDVVSEHISQLITYGQRVYDSDGNKIGTVVLYDTHMGWMTVEKGAFVHHQDLVIPFSAITTIDKREIGLSLSKDDLLAAYTNPPTRTTLVTSTEIPGRGTTEHIAVTTVPSGYTGAPIQVDRTNLDEIKHQIDIGMRVFDVYGYKVGTIDTYNIAHDYLKIRKSVFVPHDLFVPLALVDGVDLEARDVHLAVTKDHVRRVCVVLPEHGSTPNTILVPDN